MGKNMKSEYKSCQKHAGLKRATLFLPIRIRKKIGQPAVQKVIKEAQEHLKNLEVGASHDIGPEGSANLENIGLPPS
ncbi:MAG: hypothetical protein ABH879_05245 [archaeon]